MSKKQRQKPIDSYKLPQRPCSPDPMPKTVTIFLVGIE